MSAWMIDSRCRRCDRPVLSHWCRGNPGSSPSVRKRKRDGWKPLMCQLDDRSCESEKKRFAIYLLTSSSSSSVWHEDATRGLNIKRFNPKGLITRSLDALLEHIAGFHSFRLFPAVFSHTCCLKRETLNSNVSLKETHKSGSEGNESLYAENRFNTAQCRNWCTFTLKLGGKQVGW